MRKCRSFLTTPAAATLAVAFLASAIAQPFRAQSAANHSTVPQWQIDAGGKMGFDVASVKQNKSGPSGTPHTNMGLDAGEDYTSTGGLFAARDYPLGAYIGFAYKLTFYQNQFLASQLPKWTTAERFDIEAHTGRNTTKDQIRLMMQSLLADRLKLAVHFENRRGPLFGLVLAKPGKTGPQTRSAQGRSTVC